MKPALLIVNHDAKIRLLIKRALEKDYSVLIAGSHRSALEKFRQQKPAVVLLDLGLPPSSSCSRESLRVLSELTRLDRSVKVIVSADRGEKADVFEAIAQGAHDFVRSPIHRGEVKTVLKRAFYLVNLERELAQIPGTGDETTFESIQGSSQPMQQLWRTVAKVSRATVPAVIVGEAGTGKQEIARAIHRRSDRREGPFVVVNCAATSQPQLECELFGGEPSESVNPAGGAKSRLKMAQGGTLLLSEVGEVPIELQVRLLRFLKQRRFERLGGPKEETADVRVLASTNADLRPAIEAGRFRRDLYYCLAVVVLEVPPLRERERDVLLLAHSFLSKFAEQEGKDRLRFTNDVIETLLQHDWPGNVNELENRIQRAVVMAEEKRIGPVDLGLNNPRATPLAMARIESSLRSARQHVERAMILDALKRHNGRYTRAAESLGVSRPTLYQLMQKLGIKPRSEECQS